MGGNSGNGSAKAHLEGVRSVETNKLIDRLREISRIGIVNYKHDAPVLIEAADRLEELEKRNEPIEQEPKLLTLEEVKAFDWDYCYLEEERLPGNEYRAVCGDYALTCITWPCVASMRIQYGDNGYGKKWRCWTAKPTDEQRRDVKWDAEK